MGVRRLEAGSVQHRREEGQAPLLPKHRSLAGVTSCPPGFPEISLLPSTLSLRIWDGEAKVQGSCGHSLRNSHGGSSSSSSSVDAKQWAMPACSRGEDGTRQKPGETGAFQPALPELGPAEETHTLCSRGPSCPCCWEGPLPASPPPLSLHPQLCLQVDPGATEPRA